MGRNSVIGMLLVLILVTWFISGCGAGTTATTNPPPNSNPLPVITALSPSSTVAGSTDTTVTITGTGFISTSTAEWNGTALTTTFVSATELKATVPAADLTGSSASQIAIQNPAPGGGTSPPATFDVNSPAPIITAISPPNVDSGSAATITITGTGFETNSQVMWNGWARPTTVVSTTVLQVALSASDLQNQGTGSLTVSNPGPGASTSPASQLTIISLPVIQDVNIVSTLGTTESCSQLQATITGLNFAPNSTVQANGIALQSVFYSSSSTTLTAIFPLGFTSAPGALSFTVTNPGQVGAVSAPFPYPATIAPTFALCTTPSPTTVYSGTSFSFIVQPTEVNLSGNATLTLGSLPAGITTANTTMPLPPSGANV